MGSIEHHMQTHVIKVWRTRSTAKGAKDAGNAGDDEELSKGFRHHTI